MGLALPAYPQVVAPAWCAAFVGLPYKRRGRGPDKFDCWGLLMLVLDRQFGIKVPAYEGICWDNDDKQSRSEAAALIGRDSAAMWRPVEPGSEQPGDAIVLRIYGAPLHVGVVVLPGLMLHSAEDADSALERYDGLCWRNRVEGLWRFGTGQ